MNLPPVHGKHRLETNRTLFFQKHEQAENDATLKIHSGMETFVQRKSKSLQPCQCNFKGCGKIFSKRSNLKAHMRVHSGILPYACHFPGCTKRFRWKSSLKPHIKVHVSFGLLLKNMEGGVEEGGSGRGTFCTCSSNVDCCSRGIGDMYMESKPSRLNDGEKRLNESEPLKDAAYVSGKSPACIMDSEVYENVRLICNTIDYVGLSQMLGVGNKGVRKMSPKNSHTTSSTDTSEEKDIVAVGVMENEEEPYKKGNGIVTEELWNDEFGIVEPFVDHWTYTQDDDGDEEDYKVLSNEDGKYGLLMCEEGIFGWLYE